MKKEIIKTEDYLLVVDDSKIKEGDYRVNIQRCYVKLADREGLDYYNKRGDVFKKAIAHLPLNNSPILEGVPLLPPLEVEDDIEKLNEDLFDKGSDNVLHPQYQMRIFFNMGYNKAREKYKFTEEDLWVVFNYGRSNMHEETFESVIKRVSQPKTPTHFDFEMEKDYRYNDDGEPIGFKVHDSNVIKTTTNSQGQQVACGKYIY